jgi:hypothetical protein
VIEFGGHDLDNNTLRRLRGLSRVLSPGSDRSHELGRILENF